MLISPNPRIQTISPQRSAGQAPKPNPDPSPENPQDHVSHHSTGSLKTNLAWGGIMVGCGALGYAGSAAHAIPYVGPVISGITGAVAGASAGALIASKAPGEHIKLGAALGLAGGAVLGAHAGTPATGAIMALAGATVPMGGLIAIFAGAQ